MDTKQPDPVAHAARLLREFAQELRETETLPPLHQWTGEDEAMARAAHDEYVAAADALEAWEISVGAPLRTGYDAARLEIESLQARVQELGQMARDCNSRRVMELQAELVKESARTAAEKLRADQMTEQHRMQCEISKADRAKVQGPQAMLAAVGAGGVEPLRKRECLHKIDEPDHFRGATQMVQAARHASQRDELLQVALDFIGTLTGMSPPPIETAPPEVFSPFYAFVDRVQAITAPQAQADAPVVPVANCYSDDDGDRWRDRPDDCEFVKGRALGEEFELQASIRSWTEVFRVTKVPDENSDDYEVEPVSMRTTSAPQAQADARDALEEAASVLSSINKGASNEVTVGDEVCYWQRKEWIEWAEKEVLPKVRAAIAAAKGE